MNAGAEGSPTPLGAARYASNLTLCRAGVVLLL